MHSSAKTQQLLCLDGSHAPPLSGSDLIPHGPRTSSSESVWIRRTVYSRGMGPQRWALCASSRPSHGSGAVTLSRIRDLDSAEAHTAIRATTLISEIVNASPYAKLLELTQLAEQATEAEGHAVQAWKNLRLAYEDYIDGLGASHPSPASDSIGRLIAFLVDPRPTGAAVDLPELCDAALGEVELALAKELLGRKSDIADAISVVRNLANEVKHGDAVLVKFGEIRDNLERQQLDMTLRSVSVSQAEALERALHEAHAMVEEAAS